MRPEDPTINTASGTSFQPLAPLLRSTSSDSLNAAKRRVAALDHAQLLEVFSKAFASSKRLAAFLIAEELTKRGVPPAFRYPSEVSSATLSVDQRFDLLLADLRWLRFWYPDHTKNIRYMRYRALFSWIEPAFHRAAEYVFYQGKRPAWKVVASMSMDQRQQWDCIWLRSAPIKKHDAATQGMQDEVFETLRKDLFNVRRTCSFTEDDIQSTLERRYALWRCWRMTDGGPTETATRYQQMTGLPISRQAAAKQLQKIQQTLGKKRVAASRKSD